MQKASQSLAPTIYSGGRMISRFEHDQEDEDFYSDKDTYIEPILPVIAVIGIYVIAALLGVFSWMGVQ